MDRQIFKTLSYFQFFQYAPTVMELHMYVEMKIGESELKNRLNRLIEQKKIRKQYIDSATRYTLGEYSKLNFKFKIRNLKKKFHYSREKIKKIKGYVRILSLFPQIHLIGLSGSVAMMNAEKSDDIDLFIISSTHRVWTARFLAVVTARILSIGRKRGEKRGEYGGKVCLNLFFDGSDLSLPKKKRTLYGAHEVLQMKPLIDKQNTYNRFLKANIWVFKIFPNAENNLKLEIRNLKLNSNFKLKIKNYLGDYIEHTLKLLQLFLIRRHQTTELITDTQLWFHPEDFEKKMKKKVMLE